MEGFSLRNGTTLFPAPQPQPKTTTTALSQKNHHDDDAVVRCHDVTVLFGSEKTRTAY